METVEPRPITRAGILAFRWSAQGLDRAPGSVTDPGDVAALDVGVQDTGRDGAGWALTLRGFDAGRGADLDRRLFLAWTLRGAPHAYRRADLADVAVATAPFDEDDAAKRIVDAARPLREAGICALDALRTQARLQRGIVTRPTTKGELSTALTTGLARPYLRWCRPCRATHSYELTFRLAALQAGLELTPGSSPPVLVRTGLAPQEFAHAGTDAKPRFDVIRGYLRFHGPATVQDVAAHLNASPTSVRAAWPADVEPVRLDGETRQRWILAEDVSHLTAAQARAGSKGAAVANGTRGKAGPVATDVRLLGPYDPYVQLRDRATLVSDARAKTLWPTLGRPGAVAVAGEIVGVWRPRASARALTVQVEWWARPDRQLRTAIEGEAERLAAFRGLPRADITEEN